MPLYYTPYEESNSPLRPSSPVMPGRFDRRVSEESVRTEFCDGPVEPFHSTTKEAVVKTEQVDDRVELIRRIKSSAQATGFDRDVRLWRKFSCSVSPLSALIYLSFKTLFAKCSNISSHFFISNMDFTNSS